DSQAELGLSLIHISEPTRLDVIAYAVFCLKSFQAEDGIRDDVESRGLGDVYKRQMLMWRYFMVGATGRGYGWKNFTPNIYCRCVRRYC
ncbi:hypothetical protein ACX3VG_16065, partial [Escherichia coli]